MALAWAAPALLALVMRSPSASAEDDAGAPGVTMTCAPVQAPGRVLCEVEARVAADESIAWGDVVIAKTPPFAAALRGRIGPHDTTAHEATAWRWALALLRGARQGHGQR